MIDAARAHGFKSVSVDLIYGLPQQNVISFNRTLEQILALAPDRLSIYNYAHLPACSSRSAASTKPMLPSAETKLQILALAISRLTEAGYVYIGMDHFAKPDDELAMAQRQGRLHRNFQGYSTYADCDLLAFGVSVDQQGRPDLLRRTSRRSTSTTTASMPAALPVLRGIELTRRRPAAPRRSSRP